MLTALLGAHLKKANWSSFPDRVPVRELQWPNSLADLDISQFHQAPYRVINLTPIRGLISVNSFVYENE